MHVPQILLLLLLAIGLAGSASAQNLTTPTTTSSSAAPEEPGHHHPWNYTVINSDCPCDRHARRFCTLFRRAGVRDGACKRISRDALSMRVFDDYIAADNALRCTAYEGSRCDGRMSPGVEFRDNTRCVDPTRGGEKHGWPYRSFRCVHPGRGADEKAA